MKVRFRQTGGFAGLVRALEMDASALPAAEAASLSALRGLHDAGGLTQTSPTTARDFTSYHVEIEDQGQTTRLSLTDQTIPECARPLLLFLRRNAKPASPTSED